MELNDQITSRTKNSIYDLPLKKIIENVTPCKPSNMLNQNNKNIISGKIKENKISELPQADRKTSLKTYQNLHNKTPRTKQHNQSIHNSSFRSEKNPLFCVKYTGNSLSSTKKGAKMLVYPKISIEEEKITRNWLKQMNMITYSSQENAELLLNPYRNGILLGNLIEKLEGIKLNIIINPKNIIEIQRNFEEALSFLEKAKPNELLPIYFGNIDSYIKGEKIAFWGLLNNIRNIYPQASVNLNSYFHLEQVNLPFSVEELRNMEIKLLNWFSGLGVLQKENATTLIDIENEIKSGSIIVKLTEMLCKTKIIGIFKNPRTDTAIMSNIRKSFEMLRKCPKINTKYLWSEKEIFNGNLTVIMGFFDELWKYFFKEFSSVLNRNNSSSESLKKSANKNSGNLLGSNTGLELNDENSPKPEKIPIINANVSIEDLVKSEDLHELLPRPLPRPAQGFQLNREVDIYPKSPHTGKCSEEKDAKSIKNSETRLLTWLLELGVKVPETLSFSYDKNTIFEEFKDGVLLAQIVGILEMKNIEGINPNPKSTATALHNIKKSLEVLKKKKAIPLYYIYSEESIAKGDPEIIIGLLKSMKYAYKNTELGRKSIRNRSNLGKKSLSFHTSKKESNQIGPFGTLNSSGKDNTQPLASTLS